MNRRLLSIRCTALILAVFMTAVFWTNAGYGQDQAAGQAPRGQTPVMQNVFFNVVYGSAVGALIGLAFAVEASSDKTQPTNTRGASFQGATIGGLVGLGVGLWLVYGGITFDPASLIVRDGPTPGGDPVALQPRDLKPAPGEQVILTATTFTSAMAPFALETAPQDPSRVTGFRALVMDVRF